MDMKNALGKYKAHIGNCVGKKKDALGNPVEMRLTFDEWCKVWQDSGHWDERGCRRGQYCMSRYNDLGHYEVGNVFIQLHVANSRDALCGKPNVNKGKKSETALIREQQNAEYSLAWHRARVEAREAKHRANENRIDARTLKTSADFTQQYRQNISKSKLKPCTIDGVTIFESRGALVKALGHGKNGNASPNFRFIVFPESSNRPPCLDAGQLIR